MLIAIIFFPGLLLYTKSMILAMLINLTKEMVYLNYRKGISLSYYVFCFREKKKRGNENERNGKGNNKKSNNTF